MAVNQQKQKGGRDIKISLDFTKEELEQIDGLRGKISRSDFISFIVAWFEDNNISFHRSGGAIALSEGFSSNRCFAVRKNGKFEILRPQNAKSDVLLP